MQAPQLIRKYYEVHPLEDKRMMEQTRMIFSSPTPQPTWLLKSDPQNTFKRAETAATTLATVTAAAAMTARTAGLPTPLTPMQPPQNLFASLVSHLDCFFVTLPSIPNINLSNSTRALYPITVPSKTFLTNLTLDPKPLYLLN
jgi:hypothetical protein